MCRHCPTHDAAGEGIYDNREIQEARPGGYVGDVSHSEFIDRCNCEVSLDQIRSLLDGLGGWLELSGQFSRRATSAHKLDDLVLQLGWIRGACWWHSGSPF